MPFENYSRDPILESIPSGGGLPSHHKPIKDFPGVLDVVAVVSNPCRYRSRYDLYRAFERHMYASGVRLTTVELAHGGRPWEVTRQGDPRHVQLRTDCEIWHKENLINLGIASLPRNWEYVAWIDADLTFNRPDWAQETLQQLQHYDIVQPFSHSVNMSGDYHPIYDSIHRVPKPGEERKIVASWLYCHVNGIPKDAVQKKKFLTAGYQMLGGKYVWHSGFAWAARRSAIDAIGGLIDWAVLGSADRHMADMMVGDASWSPMLSSGYQKLLGLYKARFDSLRGNFGYVDGLVTHHWHGSLVNRSYTDRWKLLYEYQFDPIVDLRRDWQGLYQLVDDGTPRMVGFRDSVRRYFRERDEDARS